MLHLPGYHLTSALSETSRLYRGRRLHDDRPVIVKLPPSGAVAPSDREALRYEWQLLRQLEVEGVATVIAAELDRDLPRLIFDDPGGQLLSQHAEPLDLTQFLDLASNLAEILGRVHQANVAHCHLSPDAILFDPETKTVTLWDFGYAVVLEEDEGAYAAPKEEPHKTLHEASRSTLIARSRLTLAYVAPEQTGRINRGIDYRTDFYALGITCFRLLTGRVPFDRDDPLELVHAHIAQASPTLSELDPTIPSAVSAIVAKLLAKMPEDRYQTAWGLQIDLVLCLIQWEATGEIIPSAPAEYDATSRLQFPTRLYGREAEQVQLAEHVREIGLLDATGDIARQAPPQLVLIVGGAGLGKSSLMAASVRSSAPHYGYVLTGQFESSPQALTYSAFVHMVQAFARQLLTETADRVAEWRSRLRGNLGRGLSVLVELAPDLQWAIDLDAEDLEPPDEPASYSLVLQRFFWTLALSPYPVALVLDDIQWATASTLEFLGELLSTPPTRSLLIIGAYRPETEAHRLADWGDRLRQRGVAGTAITLMPLDLAATIELVAATLQQSAGFVAPLATQVFQKTDGNPFFVREFLKTIYEANILAFDNESKSWQWDLDRVQAQAITDNVLELRLDKLYQLPQPSQHVLSLGACLGRRFRLRILAQLQHCTVRTLLRDLTPAIIEGLLSLPSEVKRRRGAAGRSREVSAEQWGTRSSGWVNGSQVSANLAAPAPTKHQDLAYEFLHDMVRQAAYQLIPTTQRPAVHLEIGHILLRDRSPSRETLPDLVYHWNLAADAICDDRDHVERACLNLAAARQAKQEDEYAIAITYCEAGLDALAQVAPRLLVIEPYLKFELNLERATLNYLQGQLEQSEAQLAQLLPDAERPDDLAALYSLIVVEQTLRGDYETLWRTLTVGAAKLGIDLELDNQIPWSQQIRSWPQTLPASGFRQPEPWAVMSRHPIGALLEQAIAPAAIAGRPERLAVLVTQLLNQSSQPTPELAIAYAVGGILFHTCGDVARAQQWFTAARLMSQYCGERRSTYRVQTVYDIYFAPWHESIATVLLRLKQLAKDTLSAREVQYSSYARVAQVVLGLYGGVPLMELRSQLEATADFCQHHYNHWASELSQHLHAHVVALQGHDRGAKPVAETIANTSADDDFDTSIIAVLDATHTIQRDYLAGHYDRAIALAERLDGHTTCLLDFVALAQYQFYWGLAIAARLAPTLLTVLSPRSSPAPEPSPSERDTLYQQLGVLDYHFDRRSRRGVAEFQCQHALLAAEIARVDCEFLAAIDHYDRAIRLATQHHLDHYNAIANEQSARLWLERGNRTVARSYLHEALRLYNRWGCQLKVASIEGDTLGVLFNQLSVSKAATLALPGADAPDAPDRLDTSSTDDAPIAPLADPHNLPHLTVSELNRTFDNRSQAETMFDMETAIKTSQILAGETQLERLLDKLMRLVLANAGATAGSLSLNREGKFQVVAHERVENVIDTQPRRQPSPNHPGIPQSLLNYVARTNTSVLLNDVRADRTFAYDPYIQRVQPKSILCSPIQGAGHLIGILYLENVLTAGAFTDDRLGILMLICAQAAVALENAELYDTLRRSEQRERERAAELDRSLAELQTAQLQLVQSEKMATLGQLVAGVAHEINNPIGFIDANLDHARGYVDDLLSLIDAYQRRDAASELEDSDKVGDGIDSADSDSVRDAIGVNESDPSPHVANSTPSRLSHESDHESEDIRDEIRDEIEDEIEALIEDIDLDFLRSDLPKLLSSMKVGTDRIRQISQSLRTFSRSDTSKPVSVDLHEGLDSTLMILKPRLKFTDHRADIEVVRDYGALPPVVCYAGQLNQVFTNLIANAIDAFDELADRYHCDALTDADARSEEARLMGCRITIATAMNLRTQEVTVHIRDNGPGMPPDVRDRIFDRLFTTKAVGKGTGLGLSISRQIIVETHKGRLTCESTPGQGTTFTIVIPVNVDLKLEQCASEANPDSTSGSDAQLDAQLDAQ